MKELISRADALAVAMHSKDPVEGIKNLPAVDAVEVVRCKDCKYGHPTIDRSWVCSEAKCQEFVGEEHFCSYGERRMDGE